MDVISALRDSGRLVTRQLPGGEPETLVVKAGLFGPYDPETRTVSVVASTADVDRMGDIIEQEGWDLGAYATNSVVLLDHWPTVRSIAGTARLAVVDGVLGGTVTLDPPEENEAARVAAARLKAGSLRAVSVGFKPLEVEPILDADRKWTGGFRFKRQELLELSFVAIPANPNALVSASAPKPPASKSAPEREALVSTLRDVVSQLTRKE